MQVDQWNVKEDSDKRLGACEDFHIKIPTVTDFDPVAVEDLKIKDIFKAKSTKNNTSQKNSEYSLKDSQGQKNLRAGGKIPIESQATNPSRSEHKDLSQTVSIKSEISHEDIQILHLSSKLTESNDVNDKSQEKEVHGAAPSESVTYNRKEKSLGELCRRFLFLYGTPQRGLLFLDQCTKELGVERRRIYDIINILESFNVIRRCAKNEYKWRGIDKIVASIQKQIQYSVSTTVSF